MHDRDDLTARRRALERVRSDLRAAESFEEHCTGKNLVFGEGNPAARLTLIGEAPGGQEDRHGHPFVGPAGQILNDALAAAGLARDDVWVTNVVKCRPTMPGVAGRLRNRAPTPDEVDWFLPWLLLEISVVAPRAIACLGATAGSALLRRPLRITKERGNWFEGPEGVATMVTYHPAYLLRRVAGRDDRFSEFVDDLHAAAERAEALPRQSKPV